MVTHKEQICFCTCFIERCSVKTILLSLVVSSTVILNLSLNLLIYFAIMKFPKVNEKLRRFLFLLTTICLIKHCSGYCCCFCYPTLSEGWGHDVNVSMAIFITSVSSSESLASFTTTSSTSADNQALGWRLMQPKGMEDLAAFSVREVKKRVFLCRRQ